MIEQRAGLLFRLGKLKRDFRQSLGREATAVAFVIDLQTDDILCLGDEDAMPGFVKGAPLEKALRERCFNPRCLGSRPFQSAGQFQVFEHCRRIQSSRADRRASRILAGGETRGGGHDCPGFSCLRASVAQKVGRGDELCWIEESACSFRRPRRVEHGRPGNAGRHAEWNSRDCSRRERCGRRLSRCL